MYESFDMHNINGFLIIKLQWLFESVIFQEHSVSDNVVKINGTMAKRL